MTREEFDAIVAAMKPFVMGGPVELAGGRRGGKPNGSIDNPIPVNKGDTLKDVVDSLRIKERRPPTEPFNPKQTAPFDEEAMYQRFRARMIDDARLDPVLLHLLMNQPEIIVEYECQVETLDGSTLKGRAARLIAQGWFSEARATSAVRRELARTGADPGGGGNLSDRLSELQRAGFLVKEGDAWLAAPGIKITEKEISR